MVSTNINTGFGSEVGIGTHTHTSNSVVISQANFFH